MLGLEASLSLGDGVAAGHEGGAEHLALRFGRLYARSLGIRCERSNRATEKMAHSRQQLMPTTFSNKSLRTFTNIKACDNLQDN